MKPMSEMDTGSRASYNETEDILYVAPTGPYRPPRLLHREQKSQLHVSGHCATYIFAMDGQVISIHFDHNRKQVFYQGHNLTNIALTRQVQLYLVEFQNKLAIDPKGRILHSSFCLLLSELLADAPSPA